METSVRYVRECDHGEESGVLKPALCFRGRKTAHCIINDEHRIRVIEIDLHDHDHATVVKHHGDDYPIPRFVAGIRRIASRKGITQRAAALLERPLEDETELPPDEPLQPLSSPGLHLPAAEPPGKQHGSSGRHVEAPAGAIGTPRPADPPTRPTRTAPRTSREPAKPVKPPSLPPAAAHKAHAGKPRPVLSRDRGPGAGPGRTRGSRGTLVQQLAAELGLQEQPLRVRLRKAGLRAPYQDLNLMRKAIGK